MNTTGRFTPIPADREPHPCTRCGELTQRDHIWCGPCFNKYLRDRNAAKKAKREETKARAQAAALKDEVTAPGVFQFVLRTPDGRPYLPNSKQIEFHEDPTKFRAMIGGRRSGKSVAALIEVILTALHYPGIDILVGQWFSTDLAGGTWKHLVQMIPRELIRSERKKPLTLQLWNGSTIHGKGLSDPNALGSKSYGAIFVEEVSHFQTDEVYSELVARLSTPAGPNRLWLCGYPSKSWYWHRFFESPDELHSGLQVSSHDNAANLSDGYLESLKQIYSREQYRIYVEGAFEDSTGEIFWQWNDEVHTCPAFEIPPHWKRYCGIDPGYGDAAVAVWIAMDETANVWVYDLTHQKRQTISEQCEAILAKNAGQKLEWYALDPYVAGKTSDQTGETTLASYQKHLGDGYIRTPRMSNSGKEEDVKLVQELLRYEQDPDGTFSRPPRLKVFAHLRPLIFELKYLRRDKTGKVKDGKDDCWSALRYILSTSPAAAQRELPAGPVRNPFWQRLDEILADLADRDAEPLAANGSAGIPWLS